MKNDFDLMKIDKISLSDESIKFLSEKLSKNNISLREAINEWNQKQEIKKYLSIGDIVKIKSHSMDDYNGEKGFIGAIIWECGLGHDPDQSGKFSIYGMNENKLEVFGDYLGYELIPTGNQISKNYLIDYIKKVDLTDVMKDELKAALEEIS